MDAQYYTWSSISELRPRRDHVAERRFSLKDRGEEEEEEEGDLGHGVEFNVNSCAYCLNEMHCVTVWHDEYVFLSHPCESDDDVIILLCHMRLCVKLCECGKQGDSVSYLADYS